MRFLRGIEKFSRYKEETKIIIDNNIINDGKTQELLKQLKKYERILGVKDNKLDNSKSINIRNTLLKYLDYLDHYIISHFMTYIYDFQTNQKDDEFTTDMNINIDLVSVLYYQEYPDDEEIDPIKYTQVRELYEKMFGKK